MHFLRVAVEISFILRSGGDFCSKGLPWCQPWNPEMSSHSLDLLSLPLWTKTWVALASGPGTMWADRSWICSCCL